MTDNIKAGDQVEYKKKWSEVIYSDYGVLTLEYKNDYYEIQDVLSELTGHKSVKFPTYTIQICISSIKDMVDMYDVPEHVVRSILNKPAHKREIYGTKGEEIRLSLDPDAEIIAPLEKHICTQESIMTNGTQMCFDF